MKLEPIANEVSSICQIYFFSKFLLHQAFRRVKNIRKILFCLSIALNDDKKEIRLIFLGQPTRILADSSSNLIRSSSYESIHQFKENTERKHQIKSRNRACNDSFRQAVDKSYCQNNYHGRREKRDLKRFC
jgi:hypothetical protein